MKPIKRSLQFFGFPSAIDRGIQAIGVYEAADTAELTLIKDGAQVNLEIGAAVPNITLLMADSQIMPFNLQINNADAASAVNVVIPNGGNPISTILQAPASKKSTFIIGYDKETGVLQSYLLTSVDSDAAQPTILSLEAKVANDEESYYANVPASYTSQYSYEESKASFQWVVFPFKIGGTGNITVQVFHDGVQCQFGGTSSNVGTVSADKLTLTLKDAKSYVMFEAIGDLGQTSPKGQYVAVFTVGGLQYSAIATV